MKAQTFTCECLRPQNLHAYKLTINLLSMREGFERGKRVITVSVQGIRYILHFLMCHLKILYERCTNHALHS